MNKPENTITSTCNFIIQEDIWGNYTKNKPKVLEEKYGVKFPSKNGGAPSFGDSLNYIYEVSRKSQSKLEVRIETTLNTVNSKITNYVTTS